MITLEVITIPLIVGAIVFLVVEYLTREKEKK